jgi:hypothetical protein
MEQGQVGLVEGLVIPVLLEEIFVLGMANVGQVAMKDEGKISGHEKGLRGQASGNGSDKKLEPET